MKVCFYLNNEAHVGVDYRKPDEGNPGVGGTQYMIWTIACYLKKMYNDLDVFIAAPIIDCLPQYINKIKCNTLNEAICKSSKMGIDVFVFRGPNIDKGDLELIDKLELKSIIWSHTYEMGKVVDYIADTKYIMRNICVSKEQYDRLRDHRIYDKSIYIYNCIDVKLYNQIKEDCSLKENIICYVGAIEKNKGFHKVAEIWAKLKVDIPDLKLYVIGSGALYNKSQKLGKYNIAEEKYEKSFIKYLITENGDIDEDVKFFGVLNGKEKMEVMSKAKIGIVNPEGNRETFCIVAIEFEALGVPVVSKKKYGLLNTVKNYKTGKLVFTQWGMFKACKYYIRNNDECEIAGKNGKIYVEENFSLEKICDYWMKVLNDVYFNKNNEIIYFYDNMYNDFKWLREVNRVVRKCNGMKWVPSIILYRYYVKKIIKWRR